MALTSLPMPSSMPKEEIYGYRWPGALGNEYTCNAQGFFAMFGMVCMFNYNAMLCVYYACAIAFTMREKNIKRYVEPILHSLPIAIALSYSVTPVFYEMYNPGISAYAWCGPVTYPNTCGPDVDIECIRGNANIKRILQIILSMVMTFVFILIFLSLTIVIWKVIQTDRLMVELSKLYSERGYEEMQQVMNKQRNIKAVLFQAVSYIVAFLLGAIPPLLLAQRAVTTTTTVGNNSSQDGTNAGGLLERLTLVFLPLQGFFNFIIFVSHKVYNYRQVHPDTSVCRVMNLLFCTSSHDPFFISRMFIVKNNDERDNECKNMLAQQQEHNDVSSLIALNHHHQVYSIDIRDESNEELHYRLGLMTRNQEQEQQQQQQLPVDVVARDEGEDVESLTKSMSIEEMNCSLSPDGGNTKNNDHCFVSQESSQHPPHDESVVFVLDHDASSSNSIAFSSSILEMSISGVSNKHGRLSNYSDLNTRRKSMNSK